MVRWLGGAVVRNRGQESVQRSQWSGARSQYQEPGVSGQEFVMSSKLPNFQTSKLPEFDSLTV